MIFVENRLGKKVEIVPDDILLKAQSLACGCPEHLLTIIGSLKNLQEYESKCILENPSGFIVHSWLLEESRKVEVTVAKLLADLLVKENILDQDYGFKK